MMCNEFLESGRQLFPEAEIRTAFVASQNECRLPAARMVVPIGCPGSHSCCPILPQAPQLCRAIPSQQMLTEAILRALAEQLQSMFWLRPRL
jgi:hypothetical protein